MAKASTRTALAAPATLVALVRLGRPEFLTGGLLMHALGVAMARFAGAPIDLAALAACQLAITSTQLMTHYGNEFFDLGADLANPTPTRWAGGSRVLVEGRVSPSTALAAAALFGIVALAAAVLVAVVLNRGWLTLAPFVVAIALAWSYSAPPLRLHSRGLGEATTALLVPGAAVLVGFWVQAGRLEAMPLLVVLPLCLLQFGMLLLIELPDRVGDASVGKRTLVV